MLSRREFRLCAESFLNRLSGTAEEPLWTWCKSGRGTSTRTTEDTGYLLRAPVTKQIRPAKAENNNNFEEAALFADGNEISEADPCSLEHSEDVDVALVAYHVVYSPCYQVPVLYVSATRSDGQPLSADDVISAAPDSVGEAMRMQGFGGALTIADHPHLGIPFLHLHPCDTATLMRTVGESSPVPFTNSQSEGSQSKIMISTGNYILVWLGLVGPAVGLWLAREAYNKHSADVILG